MPITPKRPAALTGRVFRGSEVLRRSLLTEDELKSRAWMRIRHDVYADARLERDHELACRAALARLPPGTILAGSSAAFMHGISHAAGFDDEVHVITPTTVRIGAQRRLRVHHTDLRPGETSSGPGLPKTSGTRTAWDVATWLHVEAAVSIVDSLLAGGHTTKAALAQLVRQKRGQRGWRSASQVFGLADAGAQAPTESILRVRLVKAGLPRPTTQCPVKTTSGLILHPDLGWDQWKVAVEYDGRWHGDSDQLHRDRRRLNLLAVAGWTVLHVTSHRLHHDMGGIVREVRSALAANGWPDPRS
jgi:hypothetical protein